MRFVISQEALNHCRGWFRNVRREEFIVLPPLFAGRPAVEGNGTRRPRSPRPGYFSNRISVTERGGRSDDKRSDTAMEDRKRQGYF